MHLSKSTDSHIYATVNPQKRPLDIISSLRAKMWVLSEFCPTLVFLPVLFNPMSGKVWDDIIRQEWVNLITCVLGCINGKSNLISSYTVSEYQYHIPSREERRFLCFNHLSKEFLERMIPHLKALI